MINTIFDNEDVKNAIDEIVKSKDNFDIEIPNTINQEKITEKEYLIYILLDAIYKYAVIIDDYKFLSNYLHKLKMLMKKLTTHNEITSGINMLIIKMVGYKFGIKDFEDIENKKIIVRYIYEKYIGDGYVFHAFPSIFKEEVKKQGLLTEYYYHALDELKEVNQILKKYNINNVFSKDLEKGPYIYITDSFFMSNFYANNSPLFLKEICENTSDSLNKKKYDKEAYLLKKYDTCINNIDYIARQNEITSDEENKIIEFFNKEWKILNINESIPVVALIKRSYLNMDTLSDYSNIVKNIDNDDILSIVNEIINTKFNNKKLSCDISSDKLKIIELSSIRKLYNLSSNNIEIKEKSQTNEYGSVSIIALLGILLITLGVTITIMMIGQ